MNKFISFYQNIKPSIKKSLDSFNNDILKEPIPCIKDNLEIFAKLNNSGKMIRGTLITLGYRLAGKDNLDYAIPLATAYEIFETSILVHDDIIDNDFLRRGNKTINAYNQDKYADYKDKEHVSNSIAICIGDYGLYKANNLIVDNYTKDKNFAKLFDLYNNTIIDTIRGEVIDTITPFEEKNNIFNDDLEKTIMDIYKLKTSHYSLVGPLKMGMVLGGSSDDKLKDIEAFAMPLGLAFQMQDDYLGIFSTSDKLGKSIGSDIKEFKQTLLYSYTKNTSFYKDLLKEYGKSDYDINKVQEIFTKSNAREYIINKMNSLYDVSKKVLGSITWLNNDDKEILNDLIVYLKERDK